MAKLYLSAETDLIKTLRTARAKDWISVSLHFDERHHDRAVRIRMYRDKPIAPRLQGVKRLGKGRPVADEDRIRVITINGKKACEIDRETGIMWCNLKGKYDFEREVWEDL